MIQSTYIFLTRHGETQWNLEQRMQGHLDSPLTPLGIKQAQALAEMLQSYSFTAVYSSDLERAYQTANYVAQRKGLSIITDERLRERNLGVLQTLKKTEIINLFPAEYQAYQSGNPDHIVAKGESIRQLYTRCTACLEEIREKHPGESVLIVAHGGVLNNLFRYVLAIPLEVPRRFSVANTSLSLFSYRKDGWFLESWGNLAHLEATTVNK